MQIQYIFLTISALLAFGAYISVSHIGAKQIQQIQSQNECRQSLLIGLRHSVEAKIKLEQLFWQVADPSNEKYQKYLSVEEIQQIVGASPIQLQLATEWINSLGLQIESISISGFKDSIVVEFYGCGYQLHQIPVHLKTETIEYIMVVEPSGKVQSRGQVNSHMSASSGMGPVQQRDAYSIPQDLRGTNPKNLQMVWGTGTFGYREDDLQLFFNTYCGSAKCSVSDVSFDKSNVWKGETGKNFVEGMLDASYISALAPGVRTLVANTNISAATESGVAYGNALLQFVTELSSRQQDLPLVLSLSIGSLSFGSCNKVCTALEKEGRYRYSDCWDYMQTQFQVCMFESEDQENRIDVEFMKLGLRGVTVTAASGDGGSHFAFGPFNKGNLFNELNRIICSSMNMPVYPTSSPYVLSVGGTTWLAETAYGPQCTPTTPCGWSSSGGGFSWKNKTHTYQDILIPKYITSAQSVAPKVQSPTSTFNSQGRGYPDVSALAAFGIPLCTYGGCSGSGGTSASAPVVAAMISLINDARLNKGKASLGFINTALYKAMESQSLLDECFADIAISKVENLWDCENFSTCEGCKEEKGFAVVRGWDAQTGFGQVKFGGLMNLLG